MRHMPIGKKGDDGETAEGKVTATNNNRGKQIVRRHEYGTHLLKVLGHKECVERRKPWCISETSIGN